MAAVLLGTAVILAKPATAQSTAPAYGSAFPVGVSTSRELDFARPMADGKPRPVQITTWYPAAAHSALPMTYGDYLDLAQEERGPASEAELSAGRTAFASRMVGSGMARAEVDAWMSTRMLAMKNAAPLRGQFPLIVIVQGNDQSAVNQSPLAEYLASRGYVVVTSPSYTRISHAPVGNDEIGPGSEEQATDISFIVTQARHRPDVSSGAIGLIGHSLGARGALLYAMRDPRVKVLVSLDGGIGTATARNSMERAPSFATRRVQANVLHFYETLDSFMTPDFKLLQEIGTSSLEVVKVSGMHHHHFSDIGALSGSIPGLTRAARGNSTTAPSYRMMMIVTRAFLDTHLKNDVAAFDDARRTASSAARNRPPFRFEKLQRSEL